MLVDSTPSCQNTIIWQDVDCYDAVQKAIQKQKAITHIVWVTLFWYMRESDCVSAVECTVHVYYVLCGMCCEVCVCIRDLSGYLRKDTLSSHIDRTAGRTDELDESGRPGRARTGLDGSGRVRTAGRLDGPDGPDGRTRTDGRPCRTPPMTHQSTPQLTSNANT